MDLASFLKKQSITRRDFAGRIGVSEVAVTRYINGARMPRKELLKKIVAETGGEVTPNDFMSVVSRRIEGEAAE